VNEGPAPAEPTGPGDTLAVDGLAAPLAPASWLSEGPEAFLSAAPNALDPTIEEMPRTTPLPGGCALSMIATEVA
jgi:hypothetical protein